MVLLTNSSLSARREGMMGSKEVPVLMVRCIKHCEEKVDLCMDFIPHFLLRLIST